MLRVKNGFAAGADAQRERDARFGFCAVLCNVTYSPGGDLETYAGVAHAAAEGLWAAYVASLPTWDRSLAGVARAYLESPSIAAERVAFVSEVQLQYAPFVDLGRRKSHLYYKIVRAADPRALLHDFKVGSNYVESDLEDALRHARTRYAEARALQAP